MALAIYHGRTIYFRFQAVVYLTNKTPDVPGRWRDVYTWMDALAGLDTKIASIVRRCQSVDVFWVKAFMQPLAFFRVQGKNPLPRPSS
jgi:hypothetical protein